MLSRDRPEEAIAAGQLVLLDMGVESRTLSNADGHRDLSASPPRNSDDVEAWMGSLRG